MNIEDVEVANGCIRRLRSFFAKLPKEIDVGVLTPIAEQLFFESIDCIEELSEMLEEYDEKEEETHYFVAGYGMVDTEDSSHKCCGGNCKNREYEEEKIVEKSCATCKYYIEGDYDCSSVKFCSHDFTQWEERDG